MKRSKGFTLIELLAVIVILGVIMLIAIPSVTGYITSSRKNSFASTGTNIIDAVRKYAITSNGLPNYPGQAVAYRVVDTNGNIAVKLDSGGTKSAFGAAWYKGTGTGESFNYVVIVQDPEGSGNYFYYYAGMDVNGNYVKLTREDELKGSAVQQTTTDKAADVIKPFPAETQLADGVNIESLNLTIPAKDGQPEQKVTTATAYATYPNDGDIL